MLRSVKILEGLVKQSSTEVKMSVVEEDHTGH